MRKGKVAQGWQPKYRKVKKNNCYVDERDPLDKIFEELGFKDVEEAKLQDVGGKPPRHILLALHNPFKEADWETRIEALEICCKAFSDTDTYKDLDVLQIYINGITRQFLDERASVCIRATAAVTDFLKSRTVPAVYCAMILHSLYTNLSIRNKVLCRQVTNFGEFLTSIVKDDEKKSYYWELCTGLQHRHHKTRQACTRYLTILVSNYTSAQLSDDFFEAMEIAITGRLQDAKAETRTEALGALKLFQKLCPERANIIPTKLPRALSKKFVRDGSEIFESMKLIPEALKGMELKEDDIKE